MARLVIIIIIISKINIIINSYLQDKDSKNGNIQLLRRWRSLSFTSNKYNNDITHGPSQIADMEAKLEPSDKRGKRGGGRLTSVEMEFFIRTVKYKLFDHKRIEEILQYLKAELPDKLRI